MSGITKRNGIRTPPLAGFAFYGGGFGFSPASTFETRVRKVIFFALLGALEEKENPVLRIVRDPLR